MKTINRITILIIAVGFIIFVPSFFYQAYCIETIGSNFILSKANYLPERIMYAGLATIALGAFIRLLSLLFLAFKDGD